METGLTHIDTEEQSHSGVQFELERIKHTRKLSQVQNSTSGLPLRSRHQLDLTSIKSPVQRYKD